MTWLCLAFSLGIPLRAGTAAMRAYPPLGVAHGLIQGHRQRQSLASLAVKAQHYWWVAVEIQDAMVRH
jgi:hypothetical protein